MIGGFHGAMLLARGRPEGVLFFANSPAAAWRSCLLMLLGLPVGLLLHLLLATSLSGSGILILLAVQCLRGVLGWAAFMVMSEPLAAMCGRGALWPRFIAVRNWLFLPQCLALYALVSLPSLLGASEILLQATGLVCWGYMIWMDWFGTRWSLQTTGPQAAAFVIADLAVATLVDNLVMGSFERFIAGF